MFFLDKINKNYVCQYAYNMVQYKYIKKFEKMRSEPAIRRVVVGLPTESRRLAAKLP